MNTKILALPLILLAVGCRDSYEGQAGATSSPGASASPYAEGSGAYASPGASTGMGGGTVSAVVVAVDASGRTVTLRESGMAGSSGSTGIQGRRFNVSGSAADNLTNLRPGTAVTVTCDTTGGSMSGGTGTGGMGTGGTGTTGAGTTGTGTTGSGTTGSGSTGSGSGSAGTMSGSGSMGSGSLADCTNITMITEGSGAAGR